MTNEDYPRTSLSGEQILQLVETKVRERLGEEVIEEAYVNKRSNDLPTFVIKKEFWVQTAALLRDDPDLRFDFLNSIHGIDMETHMEVYLVAQSHPHGFRIALHGKTERNGGSIASVVPVWKGAIWQEREIYDLFGIRFTGHPGLSRIFLPEDWVGYPLRKDYKPIDEGV